MWVLSIFFQVIQVSICPLSTFKIKDLAACEICFSVRHCYGRNRYRPHSVSVRFVVSPSLLLVSSISAFVVIDLQLVSPIRFWVTTEVNAKQALNIHYTCSIIRLSLNRITSQHYNHKLILIPLIPVRVTNLQA